MKKKKMEKKTGLSSGKKNPAQKTSVNDLSHVPESSRILFGSIGRSMGNLLDRTKAYLGQEKKAEA